MLKRETNNHTPDTGYLEVARLANAKCTESDTLRGIRTNAELN